MNPELPPQDQQKNIGRLMIYAMWLVILGLLTLFFQSVLERQRNPNQSVSMVRSGDGQDQVILKRNRFGHYVASGLINEQPVTFMLDTGASDISIPHRVADKLALKKGRELIYQTANGQAKVYATTLKKVALGPLSLTNVRASINPNVDDNEILLGMSFLKHVEFMQQGDTLVLRQPPDPIR
ncbi:MAG: TIGR02281 family clan AA aspartic protease [Gammaproteobacteria bacterium]|nr:TIGR02281 family clan AA aspartic protease [Gammaproteobacteria bacterium]